MYFENFSNNDPSIDPFGMQHARSKKFQKMLILSLSHKDCSFPKIHFFSDFSPLWCYHPSKYIQQQRINKSL